MIKSVPHQYVCYCGVVDAGSGYSRIFPAHSMTAKVATASLAAFIADVGAKMNFQSTFKPFVVRSDQGSAFVST